MSINGSMWTLKHEVACYLMTVGLRYLLFFEHKMLLAATTGCVTVLYILNVLNGFMPFQLQSVSRVLNSVSSGEYPSFICFACLYLIGSCMYVFSDRIPLYWRYILPCWLLFFFGVRTEWHFVASTFFLPYALLGTCIRFKGINIRRILGGDLSYGLYIYAFPIQQTIRHFAGEISLAPYFVFCLACTMILAKLSWHLIEKPAMRLRRERK